MFYTIHVSNNEIFVDQLHGGVLYVPFCESLSVMVDGVRVIGRATLTGTEKVQIWRDKQDPRCQINTMVSDDVMQVAMKIDIEHGFVCDLIDTPPCDEVHLAYVYKDIDPPSCTVEKLCSVLTERGFRGQVDRSALQALCTASSQAETRVVLRASLAKGTFPNALKRSIVIDDGYHPMCMHDQILDEGTIIIGGVQESLNENSKTNVYGEQIERENAELQIMIGGGVQVQNGVLVAVRKGRFVMTKHFMDVVTQLVFSSNLALPEGDMTFPGDVVIGGSALPGCHVEAAGKIVVQGSVTDSVLKADHGVIVKGDVIGSSISAGPLYVLYEDMHVILKDILSGMLQLQDNYERIFAQEDESSNPLIQKILLQTCHGTLLTDLLHFTEFQHTELASKKLIDDLLSFVKSTWITESVNLDLSLIKRTIERFRCLNAKLQLWMEVERSHVHMDRCTASVIRASGRIDGFAVISSSLESGDHITVSGYVRGGFIIARQSICATETGYTTGIETSLKVLDASGKVSIGLRHQHTLLEVGRYRTYNDQLERNISIQGDDF